MNTGNFTKLMSLKDKLIKHDNHQSRLDFGGILELCKSINKLLKLSEKQSMISFVYNDDEDMMHA